MHRRLHLSPKGAKTGTVVDVLNNRDGRKAVSSDVVVPVLARRNGWGGSFARIIPVRARPTMGGSLRSTTIICSTVKPEARRSGTTISRPLQIVGVSQALRACRSAAVNG
jgi:hypothetical protein